MNETNRDDPTSGEDLEPWERNSRLRQAALDAANAHGNGWRLGREQPRQRYAAVGHADAKQKRWRR
jgi:hypothetical protein